MNRIESTLICASLALVCAALAGCSGSDDDDSAGEMIASSQNAALVVYPEPYAPAMPDMPNPIPAQGARASALAFDLGGKLRIELAVEGFPASRVFGSHLHRLACSEEKAGGHYQHNMVPAGGMANDPAFANAENEAWLDFETDAQGAGAVEVIVDWLPRAGEAKSIIFHHMATGEGGVAGAKLACLPLTGF